MKKKSLLLVVALLALSGLMAAMAYSNAHVSSKTMAALVTTDQAWLALEPNPEFTDFAYVTDDGVLRIDFVGPNRGFQPNSTYNFNELFYIKNNLSKPVKVGLRFANIYPKQQHKWLPGLRTISTNRDIEGWTAERWAGADGKRDLLFADSASQFTSGWNEGRYVVLQPGERIPLNWHFIVGNIKSFGSGNWTLEVHAEAIRTTTAE